VPEPTVDRILDVLLRLRLVHGMSLEQHYGFLPDDTVRLFEDAGLRLSARQRFQMRLNNLFVFQLAPEELPRENLSNTIACADPSGSTRNVSGHRSAIH
jgi:hypothetical protein